MPYTSKHSSLETHYRHPPFQVQCISGALGSQGNTVRQTPNCLFMVAASLQTPAEVFEGANARRGESTGLSWASAAEQRDGRETGTRAGCLRRRHVRK